jgi:predicted metal-dependent phosphoesterase TrpH
MGLADLHIHTTHSWDGTCSVAGVLMQAASIARLDVIAITDHDSVAGALEALELAPDYGIEVVPGCEVSTADGHLLALYIQERIRPGRSLLDTLAEVGDLGGLCVAPHPTARWTSSLSAEAIRRAAQDPDARRVLVGIETFNGGLVRAEANASAQRLASTLTLARLANSDSHVAWSIGSGCSEFAGRTAQDLRRALLAQTTIPIRRASTPPAVYLGSWVAHRMRSRLRALLGEPRRRPSPLLAPPPAAE